MIKAIIFDFGGVLMRTGDPKGRREWEAKLNLANGDLERIVHQSAIWIEAQCGRVSVESYWQAVAQELNMPEHELPLLREAYFRDDSLDQQLIALIAELRQTGYKVGLLSNDAMTLEHKLRNDLNIYDAFDAVVISAGIGVMKPDTTAYNVIARDLGVNNTECIFIDDNVANVEGARLAGMRAIQFLPGIDLRSELNALIRERA